MGAGGSARPITTTVATTVTTPITTTAFPSTTDWVQTTPYIYDWWYERFVGTTESVRWPNVQWPQYITTDSPFISDWLQTTGADESLLYTTRAYPYTSGADGNVIATTVAYQEFEDKYRGTTMETTEAEFDTIQTATDPKQKAPNECKDSIYYNCGANLQYCTDPEAQDVMQFLCKKTCEFCN